MTFMQQFDVIFYFVIAAATAAVFVISGILWLFSGIRWK